MREQTLIVLEALFGGQTIEHNGRTYMLAEDEDGCRRLAIGVRKVSRDGESDVLLGADMSLDTFIKMCREMNSNDELRGRRLSDG